MRRLPVLSLLPLLLSAAPCFGQCVAAGTNMGTVPDYIYLVPTAAMTAADPYAVGTAASMWLGAWNGGFPIVTTTPVVGDSYMQITVYFHTGTNPADPTTCATFNTSTKAVDVYESYHYPFQNTYSCAVPLMGYGQNVAHEVAHAMGLDDIDYSQDCATYIMAPFDGNPHTIHSDEAQKADALNHPIHEGYPEQNCQEPCFGACNNAGECPATNGGSPIVLNVQGGPVRMTGPDGAVFFDLFANGRPVRISWTAPDGQTALLCRDRNGNGAIDDGSELFGDHTLLPNGRVADNGFAALAYFDRPENGGNGDGRIDASDAVYGELRLWFDDNHDGIAQPSEIKTLAESGVTSISLDYEFSHQRDQYGNLFRYRSSAELLKADGKERNTKVFDVYLVVE